MAELDLNMLSTSDLGYTVDDEDDPILLDRDGTHFAGTSADRVDYAGTPAVASRECVIRLTTESTADRRPGTNAAA